MKRFIFIIALLLIYSSYAFCAPGDTERVSDASDGTQAKGNSEYSDISLDGRFVVFSASSSNLVSNDTNNSYDIFVHDRQTGHIERVSIADNGSQTNNSSNKPAISGNGRFVVFVSKASNLVPNDTNNKEDIFVYDRQTEHIERVSIADNGSQANDKSDTPSISGDGRFVAFVSDASNLVPNDTNNSNDIFVYDKQTRHIERVSITNDGHQAYGSSYHPSISNDGRFVTFESWASNLVSNDTNHDGDIFVYDRQTGHIERISIADDGSQANSYCIKPSISADGRFVAFVSYASNLVPNDTNGKKDIFVYDRQAGHIERVSIADNGSQADNDSDMAFISGDGNFISFNSDAANLVPNDTNNVLDAFVYDRLNHQIQRVDVASDGTEANRNVKYYNKISLSSNGQFVVFTSYASNLVPNDTNYKIDVFVHELDVSTTETSPAGENVYSYYSVSIPVKDSNPKFAYPFATGDLAAGNLTLSVGLPEFTAPVDIYLALSYSEMPDDIFLFDSSNELQKNTIVPWKTNQTSPVNVNLYSNIPTNGLPEGTYTLFTLVVPAGATNMNNSYLWVTSFNIER